MPQLEIYREQTGRFKEITQPFNYMPDDVLYRLPWLAGEPEPPLQVLYPLLMNVEGKEIIDPLTIRVGWTKGKKPFAYNPRYIVNPLVLVVGTPGAGKSLHPGEKIAVIRNNRIYSVSIKDVQVGDKVLAIDNSGNVYISEVLDIIYHEFDGELYVIKYSSSRGEGEVRVTPDHSLLVWRNGRIVPIRGDSIKVGDRMPFLDSIGKVGVAEVIKIEKQPYTGLVYDIGTSLGTFMTADGLFVHNSATLKTIIYNLLQNEVFLERGQRTPPIIVVDPEGEYAVLRQLIDPSDVLHLKLGRRDYINIFDRPTKTINPIIWYMRMLAVLQKFLHISPAQAALAYRVLKKAILELAKEKGFTEDPATWRKPDITLQDIHNWLESTMNSLESQGKMTHSERRLYQGCSTLYSRLDQWMYPPNDAFSKKSTVDLSKIFNYKLIVLDARGLAKDLFGLFTYWITYWIYGLMLERGPLPSFGIRVVLVIDEAWALLRKEKREEENPLEALARRGRKYGILIIVATQTPEDVDEKMFSLFGTLVTGIIPSDKMVNKIVESRGMPKRFKAIIMGLGQGTLVWSINWRKKDFPMSRVPVIVHTDYPIKEQIQVIID